LSRLTIPGTHDSCAWNASAMSKTQNMDLTTQLLAGIRFVDIRCRHYQNKFAIHHGAEYLHLNFDDVLTACKSFLDGHPRECIVMSVKEEHDAADNTTTFEQVFEDYFEKSKTYWYRGNTIPTLLQARGKIVLLRRFYISPDSDRSQ